MTRALVLLAAAIALPAAAPQAQSRRPPAVITQDILALGAACRESGGTPGMSRGMLQIADLTGDGLPDYVLDHNTYNCEGAASPLSSGRAGAAISIYLGGPGGEARKVFDGLALGAKVRGAPRQRVWLDVQGADCGEPDAAGAPLASQKACSRPLNWNPDTDAFAFAPLREARPYRAPRPAGSKA